MTIDHFVKFTLPAWKKQGEKIVFTNGCFDLLHAGHIASLSGAAELGTRLIVGINSDDSVKRLKGLSRPLQNQYDRSLILASLIFTDAILIFEDETPEVLIQKITPDFLVKGGDYQINDIAGAGHVIKNGGHVVLLPLLPGRSTTRLAE